MTNPMNAAEMLAALNRAEEGAGTLPAKEAVKLRPADWRALANAIRALAAINPVPAAPVKRCQCANSKTNPCIVCGLPKLIDPDWLKRKIEADGEEGEIGAGFELFPLPEVPATPPAPAVVIAWVPEDELPESPPSEAYSALFPYSRVDGIRIFPVFGPPAPAVEWAVEKWNDEVKNRPLVNVHRRSLDDTWRQVIRHFGGDDKALCGPNHDDLLSAKDEAKQ